MYIVLIIGFVFFYIFFLYTRIVKAIVYRTKTNWVLHIYIYIYNIQGLIRDLAK
jgi:hypothetical protein